MGDGIEAGDMDGLAESFGYPLAVEQALEECLPSEDPLDARDFDPVGFVNELFPDEASFARLGPYVTGLRAQVEELDGGIFDAVKTQSTQAHRAAGEIKEAKASIKQLQTKIKDIKVRKLRGALRWI